MTSTPRSVWARFWAWATVDYRSWVAHGINSMLIATAFVPLGFVARDFAFWWTVGTVAAMMFYLGKELRDRERYERADEWTDEKRDDGVGDLVGPFFLCAGSLMTYVASLP